MSNSNEFMAGFTGCKVVSNTSPNTGTEWAWILELTKGEYTPPVAPPINENL